MLKNNQAKTALNLKKNFLKMQFLHLNEVIPCGSNTIGTKVQEIVY